MKQCHFWELEITFKQHKIIIQKIIYQYKLIRKSNRLSSKERIDYRVLNSTGQIEVLKDSVEGVSLPQAIVEPEHKCLLIEYQSMSDDIMDFMDENQLDESTCIPQDVNAVITKVENLRSRYRTISIQLKGSMPNFDEQHGKLFQQIMGEIKVLIKSNKDVLKRIRTTEGLVKVEEQEIIKRAVNFQIQNIRHSMSELQTEINVDVSELTDTEVMRREKYLPEIRTRMDRVSTEFKDMLGQLSNDVLLYELTDRYEKLKSSIHIYSITVTLEFDKRDLEKDKLFKESHLNIKLSKFKGYNSYTDIYSFQRNFEKLHLRVTPMYLLPDLLKNNFLDEPALSLVKSLDDINQILERLKMAYGDPKNLLERKLDEVNNINQIWRSNNPEKIMDGLSKIITIMKDLVSLSKQHHIESKLFHGNGLERIYKLLGDGRETRWISISCDDNLDGEELWMKLIEFLENELKVQQ